MTDRPNDIPQDVWDKAAAVGEAIHGRHERGFILWPLISEAGPAPQEIVARAILADRATRPAAVEDGPGEWHQSEYGDSPMNFHVAKRGATLAVTLTYPPWTDADNKNGQCRYVEVNQEAVRASDGVRLFYDYERDGFAVQQPRPILRQVGEHSFTDEDEWAEVGFFQSWARNNRENGEPTQDEYDAAYAAYAPPSPTEGEAR